MFNKISKRLFLLLSLGAVIVIGAALAIEIYGTSMQAESQSTPAITLPSKPALKLITEDSDFLAILPPLPDSVSAPSKPTPYRTILAERNRWFTEHVISQTQHAGTGSTWINEAPGWMLDVWQYLLKQPGATERESLVRRGRTLTDAGCSDPAVIALQGLIHPEFRVQQEWALAPTVSLR